jgi:hypothetical protein
MRHIVFGKASSNIFFFAESINVTDSMRYIMPFALQFQIQDI